MPDLLYLLDQLTKMVDPPSASTVVTRETARALSREAYDSGRRLRAERKYTKATADLRDAVSLAASACDGEQLGLSLIALGTCFALRGNYPKARRCYARALREAARHENREIERMALHDMMGLFIETGQTESARRLIPRVFRAYGRKHPRLPRLAHDVAHFWITEGEFAQALPIVLETARHFTTDSDRVTAWGSVARAAGGCGDFVAFHRARRTVMHLVRSTHTERHAHALLDVARGAALLSLWDDARELGTQALSASLAGGESLVQFEARAHLEACKSERQVEQQLSGRVGGREAGERPTRIGQEILSALRMQRALASR